MVNKKKSSKQIHKKRMVNKKKSSQKIHKKRNIKRGTGFVTSFFNLPSFRELIKRHNRLKLRLMRKKKV